MVAPVATLGGVGQRQQIALVAAHQLLQAGRARARVNRRRAGDVIRLRAGVLFRLRQTLFRQQAEDVRRRFLFGVRGAESWRLAVRQQGKIQQAMGVVIGRAEPLAAGNVFINGRNAALQAHLRRIDGFADRQLRQRGAVGAQQEDGFHVIAAGLLEGQRRQLAVGDAALGHYPIDGEV